MNRRCIPIDLADHPQEQPVLLPASGPFELIVRRTDGSLMRLKWVSHASAKRQIEEWGFTVELATQEGWLQLDGWAGRYQTRVLVVGETPKRFRIQAVKRTRLAGRLRYIDAGEQALVPKHAVSMKRLNVEEV